MNWKKTLLICLIILLVGAGVTILIFRTEPSAVRSGATKETAMLVEVVPAQKGNYQPRIVATGTVQAAQDVLLSPRINGEVIELSPAFVPGGHVRKGQLLLQIDPADYENALQLRKSDLHQVEAELKLEKGQQEVARRDYQILNDSLTVMNESLVLREPQLAAVKARLEAAEAGVEQAELALQRTAVRAPFDAHILSRQVNVGSQVSPGDGLGRLVGVNEYWVVATVPMSQLQWLSFPGNSRGNGSEVQLRSRAAWAKGVYRKGHLLRLLGALEGQTRLAQVIISVDDPLAYRASSKELPPLIIGAFMEANIQGKELTNVIRLKRDFVRSGSTVWVMESGQLRIRQAEIAFQDAEYAYITDGLRENDQVVITNLTTVVDGARLRTEDSESVVREDSVSNTAKQQQSAIQPSEGL